MVTIGLLLPVAPGQMVPVPAGVVRIPMSKLAAQTRGQEMIDVADELPDPPKDSGLVIANSLQGVDQAAQQVEQFKG